MRQVMEKIKPEAFPLWLELNCHRATTLRNLSCIKACSECIRCLPGWVTAKISFSRGSHNTDQLGCLSEDMHLAQGHNWHMNSVVCIATASLNFSFSPEAISDLAWHLQLLTWTMVRSKLMPHMEIITTVNLYKRDHSYYIPRLLGSH